MIISVLYFNFTELDNRENQTFTLIILTVGTLCFAIGLYLLFFATEAKIIDKHLILKKTLRQEYYFERAEVIKVSSVMRKNVKYTTVSISKDNNLEKFIILNNLGLISFKRVDAEQKILTFLKSN